MVFYSFQLRQFNFCMPLPTETSRNHNVFYLTVRSFFRLSVTAHLVLCLTEMRFNTCMKLGQDDDETLNFWGQEVRGQGQTMPKLDLEARRRHHYRPLRSSRFSS